MINKPPQSVLSLAAAAGSIKTPLLLGAGLLFLLVLGLSAFFNQKTFTETYSQIAVNRYLLTSEKLANDIQKIICRNAAEAGRQDCANPLQAEKLPAIDKLLADFQQRTIQLAHELQNGPIAAVSAASAVSASVASLENTVLYSTDPQLINRLLPPAPADTVETGTGAYSAKQGSYSFDLLLRDDRQNRIAVLTITLKEQLVRPFVEQLLVPHKRVVIAIFLGGLALLLIVIGNAVPPIQAGYGLPKKRIITLTIASVCIGQIITALGEAAVFAQNYQQAGSHIGTVSAAQPLTYPVSFAAHQSLYDILLNIGLEMLIATVISLLCLVELLILMFKFLEKRIAKNTPSSLSGTVHYSVMRPTIFLFLFGIDLSAALIPLQMERLYEPILGLPKDVILSLPVSAMFSTVGITFIISGAWMDRRGWHEPFLIGVLLTGIGKFYAWLAPDAYHFIIAMATIGFGYGLALMAAQGFVMANTTDKDKAHGIAYFFAGVYAGSIGGTAIGAQLAQRIGYDPVFLIGSLFVFASFGCAMVFLRQAFHKPPVNESLATASGAKKWGFIRFLMDRNVIVLVLFCSIPSAVAVIGFLNYFSPVYLSRAGVSESIIGGVLTLYGISMVYISPLISKRIDATERKEYFIVIGCALGGCAFLSFYVLSGLAATIIAVLLLGLSGACLQSSQTTYALKLKATQALGIGKSVAIVRASSRIGQMLGPMVFSGLMVASNTENALTYFGLVYLLIAFLFITLSRQERSGGLETKGIKQPLTEPDNAPG